MSVSTDALLMYGISLGEGENALLGLALDMGLDTDEAQDLKSLIIDELPRGLSLELVGHPDGCPEWFLVTGGAYQASRGYPVKLGQSITPSVKQQNTLRAFLEKCGWSSVQKPQFWLASYTDF